MSEYVSAKLYRRHRDGILQYTNARQRMENGRMVRGLTDAEIAEKLGLTPDEAREIRCIAELDLAGKEEWFGADAWKEERFGRR